MGIPYPQAEYFSRFGTFKQIFPNFSARLEQLAEDGIEVVVHGYNGFGLNQVVGGGDHENHHFAR